VNLKKFKKYLEEKDDEFLRDEILTLYKTFDVVREYYDPRIEPQSINEIAQKYKTILEEQFYPSRGFPELKYSVVRKAISDFKKICRDPTAIIDLQLTYVEYGVKCTLQYGDIDERFYSSMESMFRSCLEDMEEHGLLDMFEERCGEIQEKTADMGWGFGIAVTDLYEEYFSVAK
jgi:hypothetical protein